MMGLSKPKNKNFLQLNSENWLAKYSLPQLFLEDLQVLEYIWVLHLSHLHLHMLRQMACNLFDAGKHTGT